MVFGTPSTPQGQVVSPKKLAFLKARLVAVKVEDDSYDPVQFTIEVSLGFDDGTTAAGQEVSASLGTKMATGKTNDYGLANLTITETSTNNPGIVVTMENSYIVKSFNLTSAIKIYVRAKGYSAVAEVAIPQIAVPRNASRSF